MGSLITNQVRAAMSERLQDPTYGYNAAISQFAAQLGASLPTVDFTSGLQYFQAYVNVDVLTDCSTFKYPLILLYGVSAENQNKEKFREFSGPIMMGLEVIHTWRKEDVDPTAHEDTADIVEAAIYQVFNQNWFPGPAVNYNGRIKHAKQPLEPLGEGLRLRQIFSFQFELNV